MSSLSTQQLLGGLGQCKPGDRETVETLLRELVRRYPSVAPAPRKTALPKFIQEAIEGLPAAWSRRMTMYLRPGYAPAPSVVAGYGEDVLKELVRPLLAGRPKAMEG